VGLRQLNGQFCRCFVALALGLATSFSSAFAFERQASSQFHFRTGPISGNYSGAAPGSFSILTPLDFDYEQFLSPRSSWVIRMILAHDTQAGRVAYAYSGLGYRGYFWSQAVHVDSGTGAERIEVAPKRRYFYGFDLGISQVLLKTVGPVLETRSALIDFGPSLGVIQQVSRKVGVELHLGYTLGLGFSTVTASGSSLRTLVGLSYYY